MKKIILFFLLISIFPLNADQALNEPPEIHLFIHACTLANWVEILQRQLSRIETSGLYDACHSISIGVLGTGDMTPFIQRYPKLNILFQNPNVSLYERPTLLALHNLAVSLPNALFMYIHTKGITHKGNSYVADWTKYMEYFVIDRWQDCVEALKENDACGVNWQLWPKPHFSGNFWWTTSKYASTLPDSINVQILASPLHNRSEYLAPEMWLGQNSPKIMCFHQSNVNHYSKPYPEFYYNGKGRPPTVPKNKKRKRR